MHGCIFVTWEMYQVGHFRSSLPGTNNKEDGGTPASAPQQKRLYQAAAPHTGLRAVRQLHPAGACYV
jgi:hypothetical protein